MGAPCFSRAPRPPVAYLNTGSSFLGNVDMPAPWQPFWNHTKKQEIHGWKKDYPKEGFAYQLKKRNIRDVK